ncbi:telomere length regulation protein [Saitoella coloradoensis]
MFSSIRSSVTAATRVSTLGPQIRWTSKRPAVSIPEPRGTITSPSEFLLAIGRNTHKLALPTFPTWESLFSLSASDLKSAGLTPKVRRYILHQRHKFAMGQEVREEGLLAKFGGGERKRKILATVGKRNPKAGVWWY